MKAARPYATTVGLTLINMGITHSYLVPILQYIAWFYVVLAVVVLAIELFIAASLATLLHVHVDDAELMNQEKQKIYVMAFNAFLRPSLFLFGLVAANLVLPVITSFLNSTYGSTLASTKENSIIGVFEFVALTAIVLYLHYQLAVRFMHLITGVPAAVSDILGAKDQGKGEIENANHVLKTTITGTRRAKGSTAMSNISNLKKGNTPIGRGSERGGGSVTLQPVQPPVTAPGRPWGE